MVFGKEVTFQTYGKDKYGSTLADMLLPDGTNVAHTLVKEEAGAGEKPLPLTLLLSKANPANCSLAHACKDPAATGHIRE